MEELKARQGHVVEIVKKMEEEMTAKIQECSKEAQSRSQVIKQHKPMRIIQETFEDNRMKNKALKNLKTVRCSWPLETSPPTTDPNIHSTPQLKS